MITQAPRHRYASAQWRPDRLRLACRIRGIHEPQDLRRAVNAHLCAVGREPVQSNTARRWWTGENDPSGGRTGHTSAVWMLAHVLQVSVDWLMGRVKREPGFSAHVRSKFAGDEGWS